MRGSTVTHFLLAPCYLPSGRHRDGAANAELANSFAERLGPVRNSGRNGQRDNNRSTGGRQNPRSRNAPAKREKRKPVTAADLDAELEAFMNTPSTTAAGAQEAQPATTSAQDVEMA